MSQQSLDDTVVEWLIFALRAAATLPADLQIIAFGSSEKSQPRRLVIKSVMGEQLQEGGFLFPCQTSFELISPIGTESDARDIFAKVELAIDKRTITQAAIARAGVLFKEVFMFFEHAQTTIDSSSEVRTFTRTIPIQTDFA